MCDEHSHQRESTPDPLTEFLAQLLADFPDVLPTVTTHPSPSPSPSPSAIAIAIASTPVPAPAHASNPHLTCQWISLDNSPSICGVPLSRDPKLACDHLRYHHDVRGNEKVHIDCRWGDCRAPPMLRGSIVRHVLTVHLGLLRWRCEVCGKVFSRKGTVHACAEEGG